jgi:hypothetical protein
MQQPTGAIQMSAVYNAKTMSTVSCEKNTLSRHAQLLPKIVYYYTSRSQRDQSITLLTTVTGHYRHKIGNKALYSPVYR